MSLVGFALELVKFRMQQKHRIHIAPWCVTFCCWQPLNIELHYTQGWTYGLKAQVGVIGGVLTGFVTEIHKHLVRRWNRWFPSAGVFAEVLMGRATGTQITSPIFIAPWRPKIRRHSEDRELNWARSKPSTVDRPVRTARTIVHHYNGTQNGSTETVLLISRLRCGHCG